MNDLHKAFSRAAALFFLSATLVFSANTSISPAYAADPSKNSSDANVIWPSGPSVHADAAIVMEATTGLVLYEKDITTAYYPASITKVMTALLALENCSMGEVVTMSDAAEHNVYGSRIGLVSGEQVLLKDAMYGMLLESANEVSYGIAEHVAAKVNNSSGSLEEFSALMNQRAKELGCVNSHFTNPHGLHEAEHYTCAYDMALIGKAAIAFPEFRKIAGTRTYTIPATNKNVARPLANHHRFIRKTLNYAPAIAGKTGGTNEALTTLITFAEKDGLTLIAVVLHVDTALHAYEDTQKILDFSFENYSVYSIENTERSLDISFPSLFAQTPAFTSDSAPLIRIGSNANVVLPNSANFTDATKTIRYQPLDEFVHGENIIGKITYQYGGKIIGYANIIYDNPDYPVTRAEFEALWPKYLVPPAILEQLSDTSTDSAGQTEEAQKADTTTASHWYRSPALWILCIAFLIFAGFLLSKNTKQKRRHSRRRRR